MCALGSGGPGCSWQRPQKVARRSAWLAVRLWPTLVRLLAAAAQRSRWQAWPRREGHCPLPSPRLAGHLRHPWLLFRSYCCPCDYSRGIVGQQTQSAAILRRESSAIVISGSIRSPGSYQLREASALRSPIGRLRCFDPSMPVLRCLCLAPLGCLTSTLQECIKTSLKAKQRAYSPSWRSKFNSCAPGHNSEAGASVGRKYHANGRIIFRCGAGSQR